MGKETMANKIFSLKLKKKYSGLEVVKPAKKHTDEKQTDSLQNPGKLSGTGATKNFGRQRQGWGCIRIHQTLDASSTLCQVSSPPDPFKRRAMYSLEKLSPERLEIQRPQSEKKVLC